VRSLKLVGGMDTQAKQQLEQLKVRNTALHMKSSEHMTNVAVAKSKAAEATQAAARRLN
jgi:predicted RecB family nuclease